MRYCKNCNMYFEENINCSICGSLSVEEDLFKSLQKEDIKKEKVKPIANAEDVVELRKPRPWQRFWASVLNGLFTATILGLSMTILFGSGLNGFMEGSNVVLALVMLYMAFFYFLFEPFCLTLFGTTFGKTICGLKIRRLDGQKITFGLAIKRWLLVIVKGYWLFFPILNLIGMYINKETLQITGTTSWDRQCQTEVVGKDVNMFLVFIVILLFYILQLMVRIWL